MIAHTGTEFVGADECGWLFYTLTSAGKAMLARAHGNQLPAQITVTNKRQTATEQLALVRFR